MAKNNYQIAVQNWTKIGNLARQAGVSDSTWKKLAAKDVDNVLQGHTPMTYAESVDAVHAAMSNSPIVNKQQDTGGLFQELGNTVSDLASIPANFVRGAADYVTTLPQQAQDYASLFANDPATKAKYGWEQPDFSNPLDALATELRNASKTPVFGPLIPGLHTAASLTTPQGRHEIAQHPGYAAVDVLAAAAAASPHITAGLDAEPYSATESLQQGKPLKALVQKAGDITPGFSRPEFRAWLDRAGVSGRIVELSRRLGQINRGMNHQVADLTEEKLYTDLAALPKERRDLLNTISSHFGGKEPEPTLNGLSATEAFNKLPVEHQELIWQTRAIQEARAATDVTGEHLTMLPTGHGVDLPYATESKLVAKYNRVLKETPKLERSFNKLNGLKDRISRAHEFLQNTQGKVRRINETTADFAKREAGPVGLDQIRESAQPMMDLFIAVDPRTRLQIPFTSQLTKDLARLSGDDGLMAKLETTLQTGTPREVQSVLAHIHNVFKHQSWDGTNYARVFRDYLTHLRQETLRIRDRTRANSFASRQLSSLQRQLAEHQPKYAAAKMKADNAFGDYLASMQKTAHQKYFPIMDEALRRNSVDLAKRVFQASQWEAVTTNIENATSFAKLREIFGPDHADQVNAIIKDAKRGWLNLIDKGYDPTFITDVPSNKLGSVVNPKVLKEQYFTPPQWRDTSFNLGRSMYDVRTGLIAGAANAWKEEATRIWIDESLTPLGRTHSAIIDDYHKIAETEPGIYHSENQRSFANRLMSREWVKFDPAKYGFTPATVANLPEDFHIPIGVDRALTLMTTNHGLPIVGERSTLMKVFKYAVLTGPRHLAHVTLGGLMFGIGQDAGFLTKIGRAHRMIQDGFYDPTVIQHFEFLPENIHQVEAGKAIGRIGEQIFGAPGRAFQHLEETMTNTYKVAMMLQKESRGFDREAAMRLAAKTFVDLDNLSPFERAYLKQVMPFYAFTKHLFRYVLSYPADHPYATAIVNSFARQATEEWNTGLPQTMMNLFSLGSPDVNGNVTTIDMRSADPFRSLYSDFTLGGILSQLNPAFTIPFQIAGVNVLSATPDLYPQTQWDPRTGQIVAVHDTTNATYDIINAFIPEFGAVDHYVGLTDYTRSLARNDPEAFQRQLWSSLNLPLNVQQLNLPYEEARNESRRFKEAQLDVSAALNGDWGRLNGYSLVPVPSYLQKLTGGAMVAPGALASAWTHLTGQQTPGVNPRATIKRSRG